MDMKIEYLGEGIIEVAEVGIFGAERFDPEREGWVRITILPCPEEIAKKLEGDPRFRIHHPDAGERTGSPLQ